MIHIGCGGELDKEGDVYVCYDCKREFPLDALCDKCGSEINVGDWPFCPHGPAGRFGDDPIEPYWDENITQGGAMITTRGERRAIMSRAHLDYLDVSKKKRGRLYVDLHR